MQKVVLLFCLAVLSVISNSSAQPTDSYFWSDSPRTPDLKNFSPTPLPQSYRSLRLDAEAARSLLQDAPKKFTAVQGVTVALPLPDGKVEHFQMLEAQPMHPDLAERHPEIKAYHGKSLENPAAAASIVLSSNGFQATVLNKNFETIFIHRADTTTTGRYASYFAKASSGLEPFACGVDGSNFSNNAIHADEPTKAGNLKSSAFNNTVALGDRLRTHRFAMGATGEYTQAQGGFQATFNNIVEITNAVNLVYIREVAIRFQLVPGNEQLIFTNPATDPYSTGSHVLVENVTTINNIIGPANYDIGHVMTTLGLGMGAAAPCLEQSKAKGHSFSYGAVLHELGHQFSCPHTTDNPASSYEGEKGNTIMGGGLPNTGHYFHMHSLQQIANMVEKPDYCVPGTPTNNTIPIVDAGEGGFYIPRNTPFVLEGEAYDPDPNTTLMYGWQQYDLYDPLFRNYFPTTDGNVRTIPELKDLLANETSPYERLPQESRSLTFRLLARDFEVTGGAYDYDELTFNVAGNAGPFRVTAPNTGNETWTAGTTATISWNVANTSVAPVNCTHVTIALSVDGGHTYPYILADQTPNDGLENVTIPADIPESTKARVRIMTASNLPARFFDISNQNFIIHSSCAIPSHIITPSETTSAPPNSADLDLSLTSRAGEVGNSIPFRVHRDEQPVGRFSHYPDESLSGCVVGCCQKHAYQETDFEVTKTGTYNLNILEETGRAFVGIYEESYDPDNSCENAKALNLHLYPGTLSIRYLPELTVFLEKGKTYKLLVHWSYNSQVAEVKGEVSLDHDAPGQLLFPNTSSQLQNYAYTYVAVNEATNAIEALSADADFRALPDREYRIYGLSYASPDFDPNQLLNQDFSTAYSTNGCFRFSDNFKKLDVIRCTIHDVLLLNQSACNATDQTYSQTLKVIHSNTPAGGNILVNGQSFAKTNSPQYITLDDLPVESDSVDITVAFSAEPGCTFTKTSAFFPPAVDGKANQAMSIDGSGNDFVDVQTPINATKTITLMGWIKPNAIQSNSAGLFLANNTGLSFRDNNQLGFTWENVSSEWFWNSGLTVPVGEWSHVAYVADGTNVTLYLNGVPSTKTNVIVSPKDFTKIRIGQDRDVFYRNFNGLMDEVRVYNRVLSTTEIREKMHLTEEICNPSLVAYLQFNNAGPAIKNKAGNTTPSITGQVSKVASEAPVAAGVAVTKNVNTAGLFSFNNGPDDTQLDIDFGTSPDGSVVVSYLTTDEPHGASPTEDPRSAGYWIVHNYGSTSTNLNASLHISQSPHWVNSATLADYRLYQRAFNATGNWTARTANSVNTQSDVVTFDNISNLSQFIISNTQAASCLAASSLITPADTVSAAVGSPSTNLNLSHVQGSSINSIPFSVNQHQGGPFGQFARFWDANLDSCITACCGAHPYQEISFEVTQSGMYEFTPAFQSGLAFITIYEENYDPVDVCSSFVTCNTFHHPGTNQLSYLVSMSADLEAGKLYKLIVHWSYNSSTADVNGTMDVSSNTNGQLLLNSNPGGPGAYTYVAVAKPGDEIVALSENADFSTLETGTYHIFGLAYDESSTNVMNFLNQNLATVQAQQSCFEFSTNHKVLEIEAALRVEWLAFTTKLQQQNALLNWLVAAQHNSAGFEVQRSTATKDGFQPIAWVDAQPHRAGTISYSFVDTTISIGRTYYYRLMEKDFDGSLDYSAIRAVTVPKQIQSRIKLFPNPAKEVLNLEITSAEAANVDVFIYNNLGQLVLQDKLTVGAGRTSQEYSITALPSGMYWLKVHTIGGVQQNWKSAERFIKR